MVINGSFYDGLNNWEHTKEVDVLNEGGKCFARVYSYFLYQRVNIEKNKSYEFSCLARANIVENVDFQMPVLVGTRSKSFQNNTVSVEHGEQNKIYKVRLHNVDDTYLEVFLLATPEESNPDGAFADITDVSLIELS